MNAHLGREAKWNIALAGPGRVEARNGRGDDAHHLAGAVAWRHTLGWNIGDGDHGIARCVVEQRSRPCS